MEEQTRTIRLKVTPRVGELIDAGVSEQDQLRAIRGELPLGDQEQLTALFLLAHRGGEEIRRAARLGLRRMPASRLLPLLQEEELHPQLLQFIAACRPDDAVIMERLLSHPLLDPQVLPLVARHADRAVLELLTDRFSFSPQAASLYQAASENPAADQELLARLSGLDGQPFPAADDETPDFEEMPEEDEDAGAGEDGEETWDEEVEDEESRSKYQQALSMGVSEKIKAALNGDKEWRKILIQDTNKLVSTAVLKNPRITDGEVLTVAKNKGASEEMIRLITQNREWMKNYTIRQALVVHPRVPPGQAIRYMNSMTDRDLKVLAKSREISQIIVNNARRLLNARQKRR
ncbi:MAG: hypothetical protein R2940_11615 [Syntrophotaleaceae bacterium]